MKQSFKTFLKKHKKELIIGGVAVAGGIGLYLAYKTGAKHGIKYVGERVIGYFVKHPNLLQRTPTPSNPYNLSENAFRYLEYGSTYIMANANSNRVCDITLSQLGEFGKWITDNFDVNVIDGLTIVVNKEV